MKSLRLKLQPSIVKLHQLKNTEIKKFVYYNETSNKKPGKHQENINFEEST